MNDTLREKITILVNVHNRHRHLARQLDYIQAHYDHILVFDSSDVEFAGKGDYPNVEYHYYPQWEYVDKLADIVKKVETPYVHLCADDDFYVPASVVACVAFLEDHPDYASAHGHYLSFHWDGKCFDTQPLYTNYMGREIRSDDVATRLKEIFGPYIQLLYAVHRIENLRECFCLASKSQVTNHRLVELLVSVIAIINGKHKVLPIFYGAREMLYNSAGTFIPTINEVLKRGALRNEYNRFVSLISDYIQTNSGMPASDAIKAFQSAFLPYVNSRARKVKQLPQLLPAKLRIWLNRYRHKDGGWSAVGLAPNTELDRISSFVQRHNC